MSSSIDENHGSLRFRLLNVTECRSTTDRTTAIPPWVSCPVVDCYSFILT